MIRRFYVHNFRCLENFELPLVSSSSVLLLGKNGAGKTTVGLALEILHKFARGISRVGEVVTPGDLANGRAEVPMRFEIEVDLRGETYVYSIALELPLGFRELRVLEERLHVAGRVVFTRKHSEVWRPREGSTSEVKFGLDWHVVALPIIYEQSLEESLSVFKNWLRNALILRPVPSRFNGTSDLKGIRPISVNPEEVNIGDWFTDTTTAEPEAYLQISRHLAELMPEFDKISNNLVGLGSRSLVVHFSTDNKKIDLQLGQMSDGEKCFVLQSLVIATSKTHNPLLCFWDEPDNFLAPEEIGQSIIALRRAFKNGSQIIVTSHNPETIRRFSEEDTFYLARKSRFEPTTYKTVAELRKGGEYSGSFVNALVRGDISAGALR